MSPKPWIYDVHLGYVQDAQGNPIPIDRDSSDMVKACEDFGRSWWVAKTVIGEVSVSTVLLSMPSWDGTPEWETLVFGGEHDGLCERYGSRKEALAGHALVIASLNSPSVIGDDDGERET